MEVFGSFHAISIQRISGGGAFCVQTVAEKKEERTPFFDLDKGKAIAAAARMAWVVVVVVVVVAAVVFSMD